jgi:hypothetical protein
LFGSNDFEYGSLGELLARAALDNLYKFNVPAVAGPSRLVSLPALASRRASTDALRVAAARGRLEATKGADGTWRSSKAWVYEYLRTRNRRGRRPRQTVRPAPIEDLADADEAVAAPVVSKDQIELLPRELPSHDADI